MGNHCNNYGWSGGFAALFTAISWYLVQERNCKATVHGIISDLSVDNLQLFHYIAIIVGIVLFVLSFFDFASVLSEVVILLWAATAAVFLSGVMMIYATWMAFQIICNSPLSFAKNVIEANDNVGIAIMVLDLLAGLTLISAAISFAKTY